MSDDAQTTADSTARDYRETVFLPETPFPMRAGLPVREPEILAKWAELNLYEATRKQRQKDGRPLFVLHDGPPYANGAIHIGHALNKLLKDFVVRSRFLLGYDVDYTPGWDCHGLPIEWKIEEEFRSLGRRKDEVSKAEFRERCRAYAGDWIGKQMVEFQRLGVLGRWDKRYATMDFTTEATIVKEFHKFKNTGQLYRGSKPVMWSPVERTALADAEIEYHDHVSPTVWVKFPVTGATDDHPDDLLAFRHANPSIVIWTTTPWTLPANRAISYGPEIDYGIYEVETMETGLEFEPWAKPGDRLIIADKLSDDVRLAAKIASWKRLDGINPSGLVAAHPLAGLDAGYGFAVPLLAGDHVTDDAGTGFVHTAPGHGADDFEVWRAHGHHEVPDTVDPDGQYYDHVPLFGGLKVLETEGKRAGKFGPANPAVMDKLIEAGALLARGRLEHSYPHSWRSKAPVIFRNTPQWFVSMDRPAQGEERSLREKAVEAIAATAFFPDAGRNRIGSMVESRPDWLISRQRAWGTPLAMFVDKQTGQPLHDDAVDQRIVDAIAAEGADAWFTRPDQDFLGALDPDRFEKVEDILDVWFDSGATHAFTIEGRDDSHWPADLYLEGSDQHRGWFQSSLLESCGTRSRAPYEAVLTHGFTMTEQGTKMSKSLGNAVEPQDVIKQSGADILRLWVAMVDYEGDQRLGAEVLKTTADAYRKLRNTLRYLLGALSDYDEAEAVAVAVAYADMPPLEKFVLHRLWELDGQVREAYATYRFNEVSRPVMDFCSIELSSLYFDVRKDSLYCDRPDALRRRAARTVMNAVFERLTAWLAPLLSFTTEEAWNVRHPDGGSNAMRVIPDTPAEWENKAEAERWAKVQTVLEVATGALEVERRDKRIGSALEADLLVTVYDNDLKAAFDDIDAAEIFRTSAAEVDNPDLNEEFSERLPQGASNEVMFALDHISLVRAVVRQSENEKCDRCWKRMPDFGADPAHPTLCGRCADAVVWWDAHRENA